MIRNFIFDFGKVLVDYEFESIFDSYFINEPERKAEFMEKVMTPEWQQIQDREVMPLGEIIKEMKRQYPQFENEIDQFDKRFQDFIIGEIPGMRDVLKSLKAKGYHLYGLSNWSSKVYETQQRFQDIFCYLEGSVISSEVHLLKPEREIYEALLQKFNLKAEECLFADDRPENIEAARNIGMDGIVFTDTADYIKSLADRGIEL